MADRGFTVRRQSKLITAGDISLEVSLDADGMPERVIITLPGGVQETVDAEQLERAAKVLSGLRAEASDYRYVCPTHGYLEAIDCDRCASTEAVAAAS